MRDNLFTEIFADLSSPPYVAFGGKAPEPQEPGAHAIADAVCEMLQARIQLRQAQAKVPSYTGQWSDQDYWQTELGQYNAACDKLAKALRSGP
jgi:hypothetical protein